MSQDSTNIEDKSNTTFSDNENYLDSGEVMDDLDTDDKSINGISDNDPVSDLEDQNDQNDKNDLSGHNENLDCKDNLYDSDKENSMPLPPEGYTPNKLLQKLKNPIFKQNSIDPITGKFVKSIYARKVSKMGREIWHQVWQYYRDRKRANVDSCYQKYYHTPVRVVYSGDPKVYYYLNKQPISKPEKPPKELELEYKQKRAEHKVERKNLKLLEREMKKVIQREEQKKHLELLKLAKEGKIVLPKKVPKRNPDKYSKEGRERIKERKRKFKEYLLNKKSNENSTNVREENDHLIGNESKNIKPKFIKSNKTEQINKESLNNQQFNDNLEGKKKQNNITSNIKNNESN